MCVTYRWKRAAHRGNGCARSVCAYVVCFFFWGLLGWASAPPHFGNRSFRIAQRRPIIRTLLVLEKGSDYMSLERVTRLELTSDHPENGKAILREPSRPRIKKCGGSEFKPITKMPKPASAGRAKWRVYSPKANGAGGIHSRRAFKMSGGHQKERHAFQRVFPFGTRKHYRYILQHLYRTRWIRAT